MRPLQLVQCRRITEILEGKGLEDVVSFEVEVVEEIENDPKTGKFKLIIPCGRE